MVMKSSIFWDITPCTSGRARCFGGIYRLHLQGWKISQARNQQTQAARFVITLYNKDQNKFSLPSSVACFLLGLLFDPEDGSNILLQNVELCPKYTTVQTTRSDSSWSIIVRFQIYAVVHIIWSLKMADVYCNMSSTLQIRETEPTSCDRNEYIPVSLRWYIVNYCLRFAILNLGLNSLYNKIFSDFLSSFKRSPG
jgi:hypothetical protein